MNAFAYLRVSGRGQEDGDGFTRQRAAIERYASDKGITITQWFQDIQTGKDEWEKRPGWSGMVAALGTVRLILVEKLDRVARAVLIQELIIRDLAKREVSLTTAAGDDATDDAPERVMFRQLLGIFAQYERATLTLKLRGARQRKKEETGRCEGRKPYGMGEDAACEQNNLVRMRHLRENGLTFDKIAAAMNEDRLLTRYSQPWRGGTIRKILARD
jgi:DNA invertase Pin-like site-specific DNA recombinase